MQNLVKALHGLKWPQNDLKYGLKVASNGLQMTQIGLLNGLKLLHKNDLKLA